MREMYYHKRIVETLKRLKEEEFVTTDLLKKSAFSRDPQMTFEEMVNFMIQDKKKSIASELIDYYKEIGKMDKTITKQAYSEQRAHISYRDKIFI